MMRLAGRLSRTARGRRRPWRPRAIDLFAGCGGLSLGLKRAGFHVVGAVENDPLAVETYKTNHPGVRVWETDIRNLPAAEVSRALQLPPGRLSLLAGCPPCQGWSRIRRLNGGNRVRDRKQKDLVLHFLRFVRVLRPKTVMLENVPGLADDRRMATLLSVLRRLGYECHRDVLDAADYGVPQRRRRVIVLASRVGPVDFAPPARVQRTVRDTIKGLPRPTESDDPLHRISENRSERVSRLIADIPTNGGSRAALGVDRQLACHSRCDGFHDIYGRMAWGEVAPTITSGFVNPSKGRFLHPRQNRAITPREAALLQGFPRRYYVSLREGKYRAAELIGNALPPPFIRRLASPIARRARCRSLR